MIGPVYHPTATAVSPRHTGRIRHVGDGNVALSLRGTDDGALPDARRRWSCESDSGERMRRVGHARRVCEAVAPTAESRKEIC